MRLLTSVVFSAFTITVGLTGGMAQTASPPAPRNTISIPAWAEGMSLKRTGYPPRYVGSSFSATTLETWTEQIRDGSIAHRVEGFLYRDFEGRTRIETTKHLQIMTVRNPDGSTRALDISRMYSNEHSIAVGDPVAGTSFYWTVEDDPAKRKVTVNLRPPSPDPRQRPWEQEPYTIELIQTPSSYIEPLGDAIINGIVAQGYRQTTLLPNSGAEPQRLTTEEWLSPELKLCVRKITIDPRSSSGSGPHQIDRIPAGRSPDPKLFMLPQGYEVLEQDFTTNHGPRSDTPK